MAVIEFQFLHIYFPLDLYVGMMYEVEPFLR